jgi:6-pyruvoyl tetrahydropterin synthase/QueD family protein
VRVTLTRRYEIACAHKLSVGPKKCQRLHGHNYVIEVTVARGDGVHLADGFVIDADDLDVCVLPCLREIDHRPLHDLFNEWWWDLDTIKAAPDETKALVAQPTVENLAAYLWMRLAFMSRSVHRLIRIRVYEEPWLWAEVAE